MICNFTRRQLSSTSLKKAKDANSISKTLTKVPVNDKVVQAPNRSSIWSQSQNPRSAAMTGPRFEQIDFSLQPNPPAAIEMINSQPSIKVNSRVATCDGGGGPLGHPKVFINLDKSGPNVCKYCGLKFEQEHNHHH